jgi:chromosomal replication initiation ATPase DnaA
VTKKVETIIAAVCARMEVEERQLFGSSRRKSIAEARSLAYLLVRELTRLSFPEMGRLFKRDHTTILVGVKRAERKVQYDRWMRELYEYVRTEVSDPVSELEWINAEIHRLRERAAQITMPEAAE